MVIDVGFEFNVNSGLKDNGINFVFVEELTEEKGVDSLYENILVENEKVKVEE